MRRGDSKREYHLKFLGITAKTRRIYSKAVAAFLQFLKSYFGHFPETFELLDEQLAEYVNHLYQEGDHISLAGWTISGLKRFYPRCRHHLCTAHLFYRNWQRVHLPQRTTPMTWLGVRAMASAAVQVGRLDLAILVLLGFAFFLRTMALLALQAHHVRLFPQEGTVVIAILNAKTGRGLQQSLSLKEPQLVHFLNSLWLRHRPVGRLFKHGAQAFRSAFASLVKAIGLDPAAYLPYSLRRGGATEFYQRTQSLGRTMIQGRWRDQTTARIYIDDARATLTQLLLPAHVTALQCSLASFWQVAAPV